MTNSKNTNDAENGKQKTGAKEVISIIKKEETKEETLEIDSPETDDEF
jgi:hypothetical protein